MDAVKIAKERYAVKNYIPNKKISNDELKKIKELLTLSVSSNNSQPWHFYIVSDKKKAEMAEKFPGFNAVRVRDCSHLIVFTQQAFDEEHINKLVEMSRPYKDEKSLTMYGDSLKRMIGNDIWAARQVYVSLGNMLTSLAMMGLDASPMEGLDPVAVSEALGLKAKKQTPLAVITVGYRTEDDFNHPSRTPKLRLKEEQVITVLS